MFGGQPRGPSGHSGVSRALWQASRSDGLSAPDRVRSGAQGKAVGVEAIRVEDRSDTSFETISLAEVRCVGADSADRSGGSSNPCRDDGISDGGGGRGGDGRWSDSGCGGRQVFEGLLGEGGARLPGVRPEPAGGR